MNTDLKSNINPDAGIEQSPMLYAVPADRTYQLVKMVLDHLSSRLNKDCIPSPSLNSLAVLATDILKELRQGHGR